MISKETIHKFFEALDDIVNDPEGGATWRDCKEQVLENITEDEKTTLIEFIGWFDFEEGALE